MKKREKLKRTKKYFLSIGLIVVVAFFFWGLFSFSASPTLILATTTSTYDSGLLDVLIPSFTAQTGIEVKILSVGTGQAIENGKRGDVDVILIHNPAAEHAFVSEGYGVGRKCVMYNDFVILGPENDPANITGLSVLDALKRIFDTKNYFISRGDDSGTNMKELELWDKLNLHPSGSWYVEIGQGMGDTIRLANEKLAYTLADRATFFALRDNISLLVLVEGDKKLLNQYGVIMINQERFPHVNKKAALLFSDWLLSEKTQNSIGAFKKKGEPLFHALHGECVVG